MKHHLHFKPFHKTISESNAPSVPSSNSPANRWHKGSTLVEMVITVGLLISVMVPLVGMLTMGMETSLKAGINTVGSRITNQIMGELQQTDWQNLAGWNERIMYFDDQGLVMSGTGLDDVAAFVAKVHVDVIGVTLAIQNSDALNDNQRKITTLVSPTNGQRGQKRLTDALAAMQEGKAVPEHVRIAHGLVTKTSKDT